MANRLSRFTSWRQRRRLARAAADETAPLREFAYLNETSVNSLIASRFGPVAAEITESRTRSIRRLYGGSLEVAPPKSGFKGGLNSQRESTETASAQTLRKSIVQATFKQLYEYENPRMSLRSFRSARLSSLLPKLSGSLNPKTLSVGDGWANIDRDAPVRGALVEVEVNLRADDLFKLNTIVEAILGIVDGNKTIEEQISKSDFVNVSDGARLLNQLIGGLVPVRGAVLDHRVVEWGDQSCIMHNDLLQKYPEVAATARPLEIVAVCERQMFWQDVRRVLFSDSSFSVFGRVAASGLKQDWSPVQLLDLMRDVPGDFADKIGQLGSVGLDSIRSAAATKEQDQSLAAFRASLRLYADLLIVDAGAVEDDRLRSLVNGLVMRYAVAPSDLERRRQAFKSVQRLVTSRTNSAPVSAERLALLRQVVDEATGGMAAPVVSQATRDDPVRLELEVVGIYW